MNMIILRASRWILIVILSAIFCYFAYTGIRTIISILRHTEAGGASMAGTFVIILLTVWMAIIPAIMLHSLITKRLYGFASCIGLCICLAAFYAAFTLPNALGLMRIWDSITLIPGAIKVLGGLALSIGILAVPFWLLFRLMRLTTEWLYPKVFKPLEERL